MATLYVTLFKRRIDGAPIPEGGFQSETITTSGTNASGALTGKTMTIARVRSDAAHYVTADGSVATSSVGLYISADETIDIALSPGKSIQAITA